MINHQELSLCFGKIIGFVRHLGDVVFIRDFLSSIISLRYVGFVCVAWRQWTLWNGKLDTDLVRSLHLNSIDVIT